ncbi:MAG: TIGR03960 family B12-binding radical SAM protein [Acidaminococcaceae bacterium]|nr:TIGR03960 family B12-binding radical SAM protein [Acidaminococcaceae bacterium]
MSWNLQKEIKEILATEIGTQIFAPGRRTPVAFLYPNTYHLGMSNLGLHILYQILNREGWACERVFLPEARKRAEYAKTKTPLFSMENQRPLADFPYICATLSFEMDYLNFLIQLQMGHIKLLSEERGERDPFVIIGGPCATFNPEPLAEFADLVVIGEGEETLPELLRLLEQLRMEKKTRKEKLLAAAVLPGVYVPRFYQPQYDEAGDFTGMERLEAVPEKIRRQWVKNLDAYPHTSAIISPYTEFANMFIVEVARGCGRHCRFCMAGYCFRKPRNRKLELLLQDIRHRPEQTAKVGLMGAAVSDYPEMAKLTETLIDEEIPFSCASLRADSLDLPLVQALAKSGQRTMTVAPEAGSARMRAAINKGINEEHIYQAMEYAALAGMPNNKLYFMIGLPGEEDEDIEEMIALIHRVRKRMDELGHKGDLVLSVNAFIPKPFTPYQWSPLEDVKVLKRRFKMLQNGFRKDRRIRLLTESLKETVLQAVLARGDRRIGKILLWAAENWTELKEAFQFYHIMPEEHACREIKTRETLPWDHLDMGVTKAYLLKERANSNMGKFTPNCFEGCKRCGVCNQ